MRNSVVKIRVSDDERQQLAASAAAARVPLSLFLRNAGLGLEIQPAPPAAPEVNIEVYRELARLAGNFNQFQKSINDGRAAVGLAVALDGIDQIQKIGEQLQVLRLQLLGANRDRQEK